jgi:hypothetical protein
VDEKEQVIGNAVLIDDKKYKTLKSATQQNLNRVVSVWLQILMPSMIPTRYFVRVPQLSLPGRFSLTTGIICI